MMEVLTVEIFMTLVCIKRKGKITIIWIDFSDSDLDADDEANNSGDVRANRDRDDNGIISVSNIVEAVE